MTQQVDAGKQQPNVYITHLYQRRNTRNGLPEYCKQSFTERYMASVGWIAHVMARFSRQGQG